MRIPIVIFYKLAISLLFVVSFFSCKTYNFSHPLPSDKPNIYEFPSTWQGNWIDADSQQLIIGRNYAGIITSSAYTVVKGVWPMKDKDGKLIYPHSWNARGMYSVHMDSLGKATDTVSNFLVNDGHIYEINGDGSLENAYHYTANNDTLKATIEDTIWIDIGQNVFLRELGKNFYVLNIRNQAIGRESRWWQIVLLEKTGPNSMDRWDCSFILTKDSSMFYSNNGDDYYFNSKWNTETMIKLIRIGAFEKCNPLTRVR